MNPSTQIEPVWSCAAASNPHMNSRTFTELFLTDNELLSSSLVINSGRFLNAVLVEGGRHSPSDCPAGINNRPCDVCYVYDLEKVLKISQPPTETGTLI